MRSRRTNRMRLPNTASDDDGTLAFKSLRSDFAGYIENKGVPLMGTPLFSNGASVHNGFMKNSGFIGSHTHFSLAHL